MRVSLLKKLVTVSMIIFIASTLVLGMGLKHEDKKSSPIKNYYIEHRDVTGSDNLVSAILLDYRAYDTFGEVMVLYIAITGVIILGKKSNNKLEKKSEKGGNK